MRGHLPWDVLLTLRDGEWLEASVIDAYLQHLCFETPTHNTPREQHHWPNHIVQYIPTYCFLHYVTKNKSITGKWYWQFGGVEKVLAPCHVNNNHWCMAIAEIKERKIILMDSLNNGHTTDKKRIYGKFLVKLIPRI
ncbi:unnamed protein product [Meloidogyne enterolobii]|uniref:Uncharacterized protein n=1 Tax=Meloidogyne enterolobii TaxID=390850 RepID=A0ACB0ZG19_MELEN